MPPIPSTPAEKWADLVAQKAPVAVALVAVYADLNLGRPDDTWALESTPT